MSTQSYGENLNLIQKRIEKTMDTTLKVVPDLPRLKVHDIMSTEEIKVYEDDQINNILRVMKWEGLNHVCVFNEENQLVGTLHFDEVRRVQNQAKKASELMHKNFHKIYGEVDAEIGKKAILKEKDHCLPVFEDKKIIGILNIENIYQFNEFN